MTEIVVTGARGWVGRHIVPLLEEHYRVRSIDIDDCDITDLGMRTFSLRMGWFGPTFTEEMRSDDVGWCWLSPRDLASMMTACIESDETFGIYLVASRGAIGHWDLSNDVGWEPRDMPS